MCLAAFARNDPQVSGIVEHNLRPVDRWEAQKERRIGLRGVEKCNCKERQYGNKHQTAHVGAPKKPMVGEGNGNLKCVEGKASRFRYNSRHRRTIGCCIHSWVTCSKRHASKSLYGVCEGWKHYPPRYCTCGLACVQRLHSNVVD